MLPGLEGFYDGAEAVDELAHALQCATLAWQGGGSPELVAAALVHDIGRHPDVAREDMAHERAGSLWAARNCRKPHGDKVAWLVAAHVPAKLWLVAHEPSYSTGLSPVSQVSLGAQSSGSDLGPWSGHGWWADALQLRRWDDRAKVPGAATCSLEGILSLTEAIWS